METRETPSVEKQQGIDRLFEIEEDESIVEVFTHLKALYEEQWGDARNYRSTGGVTAVAWKRIRLRKIRKKAKPSCRMKLPTRGLGRLGLIFVHLAFRGLLFGGFCLIAVCATSSSFYLVVSFETMQ